MLSIITVDAGRAELAAQTAASVAAQGRSDIEHLVISPLHSDGTGWAEARNQGLRRAAGGIIAYLDAGDCLATGAAAKVMSYFAASPGARVVYGRARFAGNLATLSPEYPTRPWSYDALQCDRICCRPAMFWRRDIALRFGVFDERLRYAYDYEYWLRVGARTPFEFFHDQVLASYHDAESALPAHERLRASEEMLDVISQYATSEIPLHAWLRKLSRQAARFSARGPGSETEERYRRDYTSALLDYADRHQIPLPQHELATMWGTGFRA